MRSFSVIHQINVLRVHSQDYWGDVIRYEQSQELLTVDADCSRHGLPGKRMSHDSKRWDATTPMCGEGFSF